jgi:hypothetical protein
MRSLGKYRHSAIKLRGDSEAGAPEIEITPEMIEAGMSAYWREANPGIEDGDKSDRRRILKAVFTAMAAASTARLDRQM